MHANFFLKSTEKVENLYWQNTYFLDSTNFGSPAFGVVLSYALCAHCTVLMIVPDFVLVFLVWALISYISCGNILVVKAFGWCIVYML